MLLANGTASQTCAQAIIKDYALSEELLKEGREKRHLDGIQGEHSGGGCQGACPGALKTWPWERAAGHKWGPACYWAAMDVARMWCPAGLRRPLAGL